MTIPSENKRNDYIGNGAIDTYSYTFKITSEDEIKVSQRDTSDVETILTLNVDYAVTGVGALNGGSVVLTSGDLTTDYRLTIRRDSALTQLTDIRNQGDFLPEVHEDTFDQLASVSLTQQSEIDRSLKVSETYPVDVELPGPQAGKVISWNGAGDALINVDPGSVPLAIPADDSVIGAKIDDSALFVFPTMLSTQKGADVASAASLALGVDGNYFDVTGTTTITSINTIGIGTQVLLHFDGKLTLTHHATNLVLPSGVDIITTAGDHALMVEYAVGKWRCVSYSGVKPSFSAYRTATQNAITGQEKIRWSAVHFDTNNNFDYTTNYRFTPTVKGSYLLSVAVLFGGLIATDVVSVAIMKNGFISKRMRVVAGTTEESMSITAVVAADGITDYFEVFLENEGRDTSILAAADETFWSGCKID